ncbi:uncharacterized protein AAES06_006076 isoform 1-T1 [Glossophaga mutica]
MYLSGDSWIELEREWKGRRMNVWLPLVHPPTGHLAYNPVHLRVWPRDFSMSFGVRQTWICIQASQLITCVTLTTDICQVCITYERRHHFKNDQAFYSLIVVI